MLRHDYDHNIASWIGLPLGVLAGVLCLPTRLHS